MPARFFQRLPSLLLLVLFALVIFAGCDDALLSSKAQAQASVADQDRVIEFGAMYFETKDGDIVPFAVVHRVTRLSDGRVDVTTDSDYPEDYEIPADQAAEFRAAYKSFLGGPPQRELPVVNERMWP